MVGPLRAAQQRAGGTGGGPRQLLRVPGELRLGAEQMKWVEARDMAGQGLECGVDLLGAAPSQTGMCECGAFAFGPVPAASSVSKGLLDPGINFQCQSRGGRFPVF